MNRIQLTAFSLLLTLFAGNLGAAQHFVALGTASKKGVYYPVGREICTLINRERIDHRVRCVAFETGGSVYNLYAVASGEMDAGITRVDLAHDAVNGISNFDALPEGRDLRAVTTLYKMPVGILVKKDSGIKRFADFPGKRINIGNLGSGRRDISDKVFEIMGWDDSTFAAVYEYKTSDMEREFCEERVDILIGAFAIPAAFYDKLTNNCDAVFLPFSQAVIKRTIEADPAFERGVIPGGVYPGNPVDLPTIQINTLLFASTRADARVIQQLLTSLFTHIDRFRASHPALADFSLDNVLQAGNVIPLHPGVEAFLADQQPAVAQQSRP